MKNPPILFVSFLMPFIALASCKTAGTTSGATKPVVTSPTSLPTEQVKPNQAKHNYRFIVSFFSTGGGVDHAAYTRLKDHLSARKTLLTMDEIAWGREGEIDLGFDLKELSTTEQAEFILQVKALLKDSQLVHFTENSTSPNARD